MKVRKTGFIVEKRNEIVYDNFSDVYRISEIH